VDARVLQPLTRNMLDLDARTTPAPRLVNKAFTPKLIEQMSGRIQALADELLDKALPRGRFD